MKTICHMYLLAPPNLLSNFQLPFKLLPLWKLGGKGGHPSTIITIIVSFILQSKSLSVGGHQRQS